MDKVEPSKKRYWLTVANIQTWAQGIMVLFFTYFVMVHGVYSFGEHLVTQFLVIFLFLAIWKVPDYLMRRPAIGGETMTLLEVLQMPFVTFMLMIFLAAILVGVSYFSLVLLPYAGTIYLCGAIGYAFWDWNIGPDRMLRLRLLVLGSKIVFYLMNYFIVMSYLQPTIDLEITTFGHAAYYPFWLIMLGWGPILLLDPLELAMIQKEREKESERWSRESNEVQEPVQSQNRQAIRYGKVIPFGRPDRKRR